MDEPILNETETAAQPVSPTPPASPPSSPSRKSQPKPINETILDWLHEPVNIATNTKGKHGTVYVLPFDHNGKTIVKIGLTTNKTVNVRATGISSKCGETIQLQARRVAKAHQGVEALFSRVERLAHAELSGCAYNFECACNVNHTEFFDVDEEFAYEVVGRWIRFCRDQAPWKLGGAMEPAMGVELTPEWKEQLAGYRRALLDLHPGVSAGGDGDSTEDELKIRAAQWRHVLHVSDWAWFRRDLCIWSAALWRHAMATLVVLLCAVIVCMAWHIGGTLALRVGVAAFLLGFGVVAYWAREFRCVTVKRLWKRWSERRSLPSSSSSDSTDGFSSGGILLAWSRVTKRLWEMNGAESSRTR